MTIPVKSSYYAPFGSDTLTRFLRLDKVSRWGIVSMTKHQSVAEHSFNVAMITYVIHVRINRLSHNKIAHDVVKSLLHDHKEAYTGDIPSPAKIRDNLTPASVIKLADTIESYRFAVAYCNDTKRVREWLTNILRKEIIVMLTELDISWDMIADFMEDI